MSAPDTNTEKQKKAHRGPLGLGIALPILFAVGLLVILIVVVFLRGSDPVGADSQVDARTGDVVEGTATAPAD